MIAATASRSLNGALSVSAAAPSVTPGEPGIPGSRAGSGTLGEQGVGVPVIAPLELQDQVAAGDARARRIALIAASVPEETKPHLFNAGDGRHDAFGQLDLELGRNAERGSTFRRFGAATTMSG